MPERHLLDGLAADLGLPRVMHVGDIAACFGVRKQTATKWTKAPDWPTDRQELLAGDAWWTEEILEWAAARGLFPVALGAELVEPLAFAEPLAARELMVFDTEKLKLFAPGGIVQILPIDTNDLAELVLPGRMAVWCEVHPDAGDAPQPLFRPHHDTLFVAGPNSQFDTLDAILNATHQPRIVDLERSDQQLGDGAAATDLPTTHTRITIAVPRHTTVKGHDRAATYIIGDTLAIDLDAADISLRAGRVGNVRLNLTGDSSVQLRHLAGETCDVTHAGSGSTTIVGGDVKHLALTARGTTTIEYGGCADTADRLFAGIDSQIAVNVVRDSIGETAGNVTVHAPPRSRPHTFWPTRRAGATSTNVTAR